MRGNRQDLTPKPLPTTPAQAFHPVVPPPDMARLCWNSAGVCLGSWDSCAAPLRARPRSANDILNP